MCYVFIIIIGFQGENGVYPGNSDFDIMRLQRAFVTMTMVVAISIFRSTNPHCKFWRFADSLSFLLDVCLICSWWGWLPCESCQDDICCDWRKWEALPTDGRDGTNLTKLTVTKWMVLLSINKDEIYKLTTNNPSHQYIPIMVLSGIGIITNYSTRTLWFWCQII